jgi:hypothetical protein
MGEELDIINSLEVSVTRLLLIPFQLKLDAFCVGIPKCIERKRPRRPGTDPTADL